MSLTLPQMVAKAQVYLQDTAGARWDPTAVITPFVNDGQRDFARGSKIIKKQATPLSASTNYPGPPGAFYALPTDLLELEAVRCNGIEMVASSIKAMGWNWDTQTGQPVRYLYGDFGLSDIRVWPYPQGGQAWQPGTGYAAGSQVVNGVSVYLCTQTGVSGSAPGPTATSGVIVDGGVHWSYVTVAPVVTIYYTAIPSDLSGSQTSVLPGIYHNALVWYAVAQCYLEDGMFKDPIKGAAFEQLYQRELADATARAGRGFNADAMFVPYRHV